MPIGIYKHKKPSLETKLKMSLAKKGKLPKNFEFLIKNNIGKKFSSGHKLKLSLAKKGKPSPVKGKHWKVKNTSKMKGRKLSDETRKKMSLSKTGNKHWAWMSDRTKLKKSEKKYQDTKYKYWMLEVKKRDNWKCKLLSEECKGRLESHHIFNWIDYPELRYVINNGITLCAFHHPKKWGEEKRMIPIFQELLSVSKDKIWI